MPIRSTAALFENTPGDEGAGVREGEEDSVEEEDHEGGEGVTAAEGSEDDENGGYTSDTGTQTSYYLPPASSNEQIRLVDMSNTVMMYFTNNAANRELVRTLIRHRELQLQAYHEKREEQKKVEDELSSDDALIRDTRRLIRRLCTYTFRHSKEIRMLVRTSA
jgi:hypothetical protein